jgi:hypothetical protein
VIARLFPYALALVAVVAFLVLIFTPAAPTVG